MVVKPQCMVVKPQCMVVKPQYIYGDYTLGTIKANRCHTHHKIYKLSKILSQTHYKTTCSTKIKATPLQKLHIQQTVNPYTTDMLINTLFMNLDTSKCGIEAG